MKVSKMLATLNYGSLEVITHPYPKNAVTYESLFSHDYVVAVYTAGELKKLVNSAYSSKPSWLEFHDAVARTRDGNFWFYSELDYSTNQTLDYLSGRPVWFWDGAANNKLRAAIS